MCVLNQAGFVAFIRYVTRTKFTEFIQNLTPTMAPLESCGSVDHWARRVEPLTTRSESFPRNTLSTCIRDTG